MKIEGKIKAISVRVTQCHCKQLSPIYARRGRAEREILTHVVGGEVFQELYLFIALLPRWPKE